MIDIRCAEKLSWVLAASALWGCGGSPTEVESPKDEAPVPQPDAQQASEGEPAADASAAEQGPLAIPTECHADSEPCTMDPKWVKKLCADVYPGVALYLNQPSSPFSRGYLTRKVKAVNASGGVTSGSEWLAFDEQVILLLHREADLGGMQVSGAGGGYDAMRWDGSCVTLGDDEVRLEKPPTAKYADIPWRYLGDDVQDALKEVPAVRQAYIDRKQECRGAYSGAVSKKCVQKDEVLKREIIAAVMSGEAKIPVPEQRP